MINNHHAHCRKRPTSATYGPFGGATMVSLTLEHRFSTANSQARLKTNKRPLAFGSVSVSVCQRRVRRNSNKGGPMNYQ